jgi:hypothetical protein
MSEIVIGIVSGALGAVGGVLLQRLIDKPIERVQNARRKALEDAHAARATWRASYAPVGRALAEVSHGLDHLARGNLSYSEHVRRHAMNARRLSRAEEHVLGAELVAAIHEATDRALEVTDHSETLHSLGQMASGEGLRGDPKLRGAWDAIGSLDGTVVASLDSVDVRLDQAWVPRALPSPDVRDGPAG